MSESKREQQHWVRIKFLTSTKAFPLLFFLFFLGGGGEGVSTIHWLYLFTTSSKVFKDVLPDNLITVLT